MDPIIALLIGLAAGLVLGGVIGVLVARSRRTAGAVDADPALVEARHAAIVADLRSQEAAARAIVERDLAATQASLDGVRQQLVTSQEQHHELVERIRAEAEQRAAAERDQNKVLQVLTPVQETLRTMQQKVTELETQRSQQHGELAQQLRSASESEERLRATAESLASALRNNATRGVWGETQLRTLVESAGLLERVNFDVQSSIVSDAGAGRPDMVVHLPGGKNIPVDAKVPFNAYLEASAIPATSSEAEVARRDQLLKQHVKALRDHVTALGSKAYWDGLDGSPELVIAFVPSESLLAAAMDADPTIMEFAFSKRVALASPVNLFVVLKTVAVSWQHDLVTREAKTLFDLSREIYGRLTKLAAHVDKLGRSIERSVKDYNSFVGSLERQVLPSARRLSQLDESKVLPALSEITEDTRQLTTSDLTTALEAELTALDQTGIARAQLEPTLVPGDDAGDEHDEAVRAAG